MKDFAVKIQIKFDECTQYATDLISASNVYEAVKLALLGRTHSDIDSGEVTLDEERLVALAGKFVIELCWVKEISKAEADILHSYL